MRRLNFVFLLLIFSACSFQLNAQNKVAKELKSKEEYKIELLEAKIDSLESSTDRILDSLYITISLILTTVLGLNIWNWIGRNRQNKEYLESEALRLKDEVRKMVDEKIKNSSINDIWAVKSRVSKVETYILLAEIIDLEERSKYIRTYYHESEADDLMKLLKLALKYYSANDFGDFHVRNSLEGWVNYLKSQSDVMDVIKDELMKILTDKKLEEFSSVETIAKLLKEK